MTLQIIKVEIRYEHDIVLARQRARSIADLLGFDRNDQARLSTAVSEIARNAYLYAKGGKIEFLVQGRTRPQLFLARVKDRGPGIEDISAVLDGRYRSQTGMGLGISGARRLMDYFHIESAAGRGTTVLLGKKMPPQAPLVTAQTVAAIADRLMGQTPQNPFEEIQQQNQELLRTMKELEERQNDLKALNRELEDTNRGIVALYAELDEKASYLNRVNEIKGRFLSNMSHEFRTPLNSITALSRLLIDRVDGELNEEQEKQVGYINRAAQDLSALVNDLLDIAKIAAGKTEVQAVEFEVQNLFSALRGMLKPMLVNPSVSLEFETPEGLPALCTDEGKVSQILRNFISNAIKFTEKGEIRVSARPAEGGRSVLFSVSDTGIGIAAEHLERIFEEYFQVDSTLQKKTKGTGLGLSLTRKLAELLGGRVNVESTPGVGSTFTAVIPAVYAEAQAGEPMAPAPADITRRPVLVIEDDETMVAVYEKYFKGTGFQVLAVRTLQQARDLIKRSPPVAVILDILLPGEDGWGFLTELKSEEATRDIPVFVITVLEDQQKGFALGAEDFATKPVERKWLLKKLREVGRRLPIEKVLVIDDEEVARYLLKGQLADTKYSVLEAAGGQEGLRRAEEEQPSLIFLDLIMPDMDGFETLRRLKANPVTKHIPVIIVTSKVLDEAERRDLNARVLAVLSKQSTSREEAVAHIRDAIAKTAAGK